MEQQQQPVIGRRFMQVKVLYTFNDDPKSNCLARCPQPLNIQTAQLDPSTEIGVIELRTCIQAIASASPELVAKLGQDYTVYAYDYSEYETPLVGQGMLSWILASASSTPTAPAHQSKTMVTGKVCKNMLGLFSHGATETLEVKLRLVPVPTCLQSEYLASMEKYRSASTLGEAAADPNTDAAAWQSFLQTSPSFGHNALPPGTSASPPTIHPHPQPHYSPAPQSRRGSMSRLDGERTNFDPTHHTLFSDRPGPSSMNPQYAQNQSRPTTPLQQPAESRKRSNPPSRPSSRASNRGRPTLKQSQSCAPRVETNPSEISEAEDGPRPKRARVTKADWNGSSNFGAGGESLRVTAATAASIRGHRPFPGNPLTSDMFTSEFGERPPTPRPRRKARPEPVHSFPRALTSTVQEMQEMAKAPSLPYKPAHNNDPLGILADSSPEKNDDSSVGSTPMDIPSSPPIMRDVSPSPPRLPQLPAFHDSGFASGNLDEYLPESGDIKTEPDSFEKSLGSMPPQTPAEEAAPVDATALGRKILPGPPPPGQMGRSSPAPTSRKRAPKSRTQSMSRASAISKSEPTSSHDSVEAALLSAAFTGDDSRMRSESCMTDNGSVTGEGGQTLKRPKTVMHEKKKQAIQVRLAESIKAGQMPRFCKNCGEINTPSWRKAFVRVGKGSPDNLPPSDAKKGVFGWEAVERDDDGNIATYRISKLSLTPEDEGFEEVQLCNPCGIWLFRNKVMRPMEAWQKQPPKPRRRSSAKKKETTNQDEQSDNVLTQSIEEDAVDELSLPPSSSSAPVMGGMPTSKSFPRSQRANSVGAGNVTKPALERSSAQAALQRAIQSSPPRFPGSKHSPIDIEVDALSPQPTKRLLFPSPRKPGQIKSLDPEVDGQMDTSSPSVAKQGSRQQTRNDGEFEQPAHNEAADGMSGLFDEANLLTTPRKNTQLTNLLETPSRSARRTPRGSKGLTPGHRRSHSNPATPSRAAGITHLFSPQQLTPFTVQLTQLLSEANHDDGVHDSFGNFNGHGMDDTGMFNFSDFSNGDHGGNYSIYENSMHGEFWNGNDEFDGSIEAYLNSEESPDSSGPSSADAIPPAAASG